MKMTWLERPPVETSDAAAVLADFVDCAEGQGGENGTVYYSDGRGDRRVLSTDHLREVHARLSRAEAGLRAVKVALECGEVEVALLVARGEAGLRNLRVVLAWVVPAAGTVDGFQAEVWATMEDGPGGVLETQMLFRFFEQEVSFQPGEFAGLSRVEALALGRERDGQFRRG